MRNIFETVVLIGEGEEQEVKCLYIGFSGVEAESTYDKALKDGGKFHRAWIRSGMQGARPLPLVVSEMKGTQPVFSNPKPTEAPKPSEPSTEMKELIKKEDDERKRRFELAASEEEARQARLAPSKPKAPEPIKPEGSPELRTDGPTFEEFVATGAEPKDYPPEGFAEVPSDALTLYRQAQQGLPEGSTGANEAAGEPEAEPPSVPTTPPVPPTPAKKKTASRRR